MMIVVIIVLLIIVLLSDVLLCDFVFCWVFLVYLMGVVVFVVQIEDCVVGMVVNFFILILLEFVFVVISVVWMLKIWLVLWVVFELGMSVFVVYYEFFSCLFLVCEGDWFGGYEWQCIEGGVVLIVDVVLWFICCLYSIFDGGDYEVVLYEIVDVMLFDDVELFVFYQSCYCFIVVFESV